MFRGERIKKLRKQKHLTQTELAEKIGITSAALSQWENDIVQPTFLNIECLAEVLNVSLDSLVGEGDYSLKKTLFGTETLKREVTGYIEENCPGAKPALEYMLRTRLGSTRADRETPYAYHPLIMVRQAMALGIADEKLVILCLLHDAYEVGASTELSGLYPAEITGRLLKLARDKDRAVQKEYFEKVAADEYLSMVKILSRCCNLSSMTAGLSKAKMERCVKETEKYYPALFAKAAEKAEWKEAAWLLQYQIDAILETYKWHH